MTDREFEEAGMSDPDGESGDWDAAQLTDEDMLLNRGGGDILDEGYSPPDRDPTPRGGIDDDERETLDERLSEEVPDVGADDEDDDLTDRLERAGSEVGDQRTGRLVDPSSNGNGDSTDDTFADDAGIDGAGASAEEAAVHTIDDTIR